MSHSTLLKSYQDEGDNEKPCLMTCEIVMKGLTVFYLITTHAPISAQSSNLVVFRLLQPVYFYNIFLYKNICCGYSFELPQQVEAIQTSTHVVGTHLNCLDRLRQFKQEAHGPRYAHLSDIATADMQMLCNIFPILSSQLMKISSFEQFLVLKKNIWA